MQIVLVSLISIVLFQGVLIALSAISLIFNDLNNGFSSFIDLAAKGATIAVFLWAVHTFIKQQKDKEIDEKSQRIKELSFRLIDYVGKIDFSLNKNSAGILIAYLKAINEEVNHELIKPVHLKEQKLALNIVYETLKKTTLKEIIGIECNQDYDDVIQRLSQIYSDYDRIENMDIDLAHRIKDRRKKSTNMHINVPSEGLRLWQVKTIMAMVLEMKEDEMEEELSSPIREITDRHHHFPILYAMYFVYHNGKLHIKKDDSFTFYTSDLIMACER